MKSMSVLASLGLCSVFALTGCERSIDAARGYCVADKDSRTAVIIDAVHDRPMYEMTDGKPVAMQNQVEGAVTAFEGAAFTVGPTGGIRVDFDKKICQLARHNFAQLIVVFPFKP